MSSWWKRRSIVEKVMVVSGSITLIMFIGYLYFTKRPTRQFVLPAGYEGWVTIRFEKPGAPPFERMDDGSIRLLIPASGIAETSDTLDVVAWGRDEFYFQNGDNLVEIPLQMLEDGIFKAQIHRQEKKHMRFDSILVKLPANVEKTLFEDTEIEKADTVVTITKGHPVLYHFYIASKPEGADFQPTAMPERLEFWETKFSNE